MTQDKHIIALDVGGSSIKSGVVHPTNLTIEDFRRTPIDSHGTAKEIFKTLSGVISQHWEQVPAVMGVGLGFPGPCDYEKGICYIKGVEKYDAIYGLNLHDELKARLPDQAVPIRFRNDAEAAIVGESVYGVGKGYSRIIGLTLGTGMGSAFVVDGVRQASGTGVPKNGWLYMYPVNGQQADDVFSIRGLLSYLNNADIGVKSVAQAISDAAYNPAIRRVFQQFGTDLAQFLEQFIPDFRPDAIILQGGIANGFPYFEDAMREGLTVPVRVGKLGRDAALLGAADLFRE